jgi:hypothetical protein
VYPDSVTSRVEATCPAAATAMADWTRTNFTKLRDTSPPDVPMQWRFARAALDSPELGVSRFT